MLMDKNTLLKIKQIVGTSNYLDSDEDKIVYSYDGTPMLSHKPQAVIMPESPSQISEILKLANSEKFAVVPRGSGTGLSGGAVAVENSIIMLMHKWDKILEIDEENFLKITDRKKDLIITAGGKNIAPQRIEKVIGSSRYISQVVAYGDKKKYLSAVVTLDKEQVESWAIAQGIKFESWDNLVDSEQVINLVNSEVEKQNQLLASFESIKKLIILPDEFTIESGDLTPSMKIKRKVVIEKYKEKLEALY